MKDMLESEIWGIARIVDGSMIFLRPLESEYALPVFIGQLEAQSILIGYGNIAIPRPITADLLATVIRRAGMVMLRAEITEIRDNTFFARIVFTGENPGEEPFFIDARPSDALALAVRVKCPIYIAEKVINEAGIPTSDIAESDDGGMDARKAALKAELDEAVTVEDYENAARIRDIIKGLDENAIRG